MSAHKETIRERTQELMESEAWEEAVAFLVERRDIVRQDFELSWNLGWANFKLEKFDEAIAWLEVAVDLKPASASARWALGEALGCAGRDADAEHQFLLSVALRDASLGRRALGFLYHRTGRLDLAERVYLEGIRLRPDDPERLETYADFLSDLGRDEEADRYYAEGKKQRQAREDDP